VVLARARERRADAVLLPGGKASPAAVAPVVQAAVDMRVDQVALAVAGVPVAVALVLAVVPVASPDAQVAVADKLLVRSVAAGASSAAASRASNAVKSSTTCRRPRSAACRYRVAKARAFDSRAAHH
jgi:hypothetical protein